jgi:hypothetical protein
MTTTMALPCDGCGQIASSGHMGRRLQRLEWATRYRPVHIGTLFLGAFSPLEEGDFLYSPEGAFHGEAAALLDALNIETKGKAAEVVHAEFQRGGFFLTHVLECPLENPLESEANAAALMMQRLAAVGARIRRSLKPKRVVLISSSLEPVLQAIQALELGCPIVLNSGKPYAFESPLSEVARKSLRDELAGPT